MFNKLKLLYWRVKILCSLDNCEKFNKLFGKYSEDVSHDKLIDKNYYAFKKKCISLMSFKANIHNFKKDYKKALECFKTIRNFLTEEEFEVYLSFVYLLKYQVEVEKNDFESALISYQNYLNKKIIAYSYEDDNNLGFIYDNIYVNAKSGERTDEIIRKAYEYVKKAYEQNPCKLYLKNMALIATRFMDYDLAKEHWNELFQKYKKQLTFEDKFDFATFSLRTGDFENAWTYIDSRFKIETKARTYLPKIPKKRWTGKENLLNKTLLIHEEQGFGDTFLTFGYIPRLQKITKKIIYAVQEPVYDLLKNNKFGIEVVSSKKLDFKKLKYDYYVPSMSIPVVLNFKREDFCAGSDYINVRDDLVQEFKEKYFDNDKFKIGLCTIGNSEGNKIRDVDMKFLTPLDELENVEFYYINKDVPPDLNDYFVNHKINPIAKDFKNFEQTAAVIKNLDLVLTTDNGLMNLSAALGKKTYCLFNFNYEFRWFDLSGDDVVWYDCVKPFVNKEIDKWEYSVNLAIEEIKKQIEFVL